MNLFAENILNEWEGIHKLYKDGAGEDWIYRGQRCAEWPLKTTLERCYDWYGSRESKRERIEHALIRDFKRAYHEYARHVPDPRCIPEWLSIMQHYGAPTRLLDFTYSVYVAAYFALEEAEAGSCAVWAVNREWAVQHSLAAMKKAKKRGVNKFDRNCCETDEYPFEGIFWKPPRLAFAYV